MNKRALMLTAATVALLSGQSNNPAAAATCDSNSTSTLCEINTVVVTPILTSTVLNSGPGNISILSPGAITLPAVANATSLTAALKIDSNNVVTNTATTISYKNTSYAAGVEINAGHAVIPATSPVTYTTTTLGTYTGLLDTIDLTGSGTNKTGLLVDLPSGASSGTLDTTGNTGGLSVSTITVTGDNSAGIHILSGVTLQGPLLVNGTVSVKSSTTTAGSATGVVGAEIDGNIIGNLEVNNSGLGGALIATGAGSNGLVVLGNITGNIFNGGTIEAAGMTAQPTATTGNPQGGIAFALAGGVSDGIYNAGHITSGDSITPATIATQGTGPAVYISPASALTPAPLVIGVYSEATDNPGYSFYNRGQILATPINIDNGALAVHLVGALGTPVTLTGGMFNSGQIAARASTDASATNGVAVTALWVDNYVTIPTLENSDAPGTGTGNISASVSGASPGQAIALLIDGSTLTAHGTVNTLLNSGTISATAQTSDTTIASLTATAILDRSGTLNHIVNSGTISAQVTQLDNDLQANTAANLQANTTGVNFQNSGAVIGNVFFGSGDDTMNVFGTGASVLGNLSFYGGHDTLNVGDTDVVSGAVLERGGGYVNITVGTTAGGNGALAVNNTDFSADANDNYGTLDVGTLDVKSGATFAVTLSQGFNRAVDPTYPILVSGNNAPAGLIDLESGSLLKVSFGSFVSTPGTNPAKFVLFDAQTITIGDPDTIRTSITSTIPFLFTGNVCAYGIGGFTNTTPSACTDTPAHDQLVLNLSPKSATDLGLTGYAKTMFPLANAALADDNTLGAEVIAAGSGLTTSSSDIAKGNQLYQNIYSQFAPEVTGASRALAVSLTDQATSVVGARQRVLRMYAGQNSAATLWGQEFTQRFDNNTNLPNGYRDSGFGFALGMDGGSPASGRYGGAFTFFSGDIIEKLPAQVKTSTSWYMLSGYSNWRGQGLFFDSNLTLGYGSLTGNRSIIIDNAAGNPIFARNASDKRASILASGGISGGAILTMGTLVLSPQGSLDLLTLRENGYQETCASGCSTGGADGFDLKVDPYYAKSLRGYLGASAREDLNLGSFFLQPEARVGYRYDFLADAVNLKAMFAADPSATQFTLTGPDPAKGNFVAGFGLAATTGSWSIGLNYDYLSGSGSSMQSGTLTLVGRI